MATRYAQLQSDLRAVINNLNSDLCCLMIELEFELKEITVMEQAELVWAVRRCAKYTEQLLDLTREETTKT